MSPAPASVVLRDVSRSFGPRVVLDQISLTISPRSRIGVIAPNGTGKSTLLRLIARLDRPDSGAITRLPHRPPEDEEPYTYYKRGHGNVTHARMRMSEIVDVLLNWEPGKPAEATVAARLERTR